MTSHHCSRCPQHSRCPVPEACQLHVDDGVEMLGRVCLYAFFVVFIFIGGLLCIA